MSLKVRALPRVAKLFVLLLFTVALPASPASADTFANWTPLNSTSTGSQNWNASAISYSGSIMYAAPMYGYVYKSVDSGTSWTRLNNSGARLWTALATNDSGTVVWAASGLGGYIYRSADSGATWTEQTAAGSLSWSSIATSSSGATLVAVTSSTYVSFTTNSGGAWYTSTGVGTSADSISLSGDGLKAALTSNDGVYTGSLSGSTWSWTATRNILSGQNSGYQAIGLSRDGQKIAAIDNTSYVRTSSNFGTTWETSTAVPASRAASVVALSGDGSRIIACDGNGYCSYSSNSGVSWTTSNPTTTTFWNSMAVDYLGKQWVGTIGNSNSYGSGIWVSTNSAANFSVVSISDGFTKATKIEASDDGSVIVVLNSYGDVWLTSNGGSTWSIPALTGAAGQLINCVAMSASGSTILIGTATKLFRSSDSGQSFTAITSGVLASNLNIYSLAMSSDGQKAAMVSSGSGIYTSTDGGQNFTQTETTVLGGTTYSWRNVTMSGDGMKLAIGTSSVNSVIISTDAGANWTVTSSPAGTYPVMKSARDGSVLIAAGSTTTYNPLVSRNWGTTWSAITPAANKAYTDGVSVSNDGSLIVMASSNNGSSVYYSTNYGANFSKLAGFSALPYQSVKINGSKTALYISSVGAQIMQGTIVPPAAANFSGLTYNLPLKFRTQVTLTATVSTTGADGKVTFFSNGKKIPRCIKVATVSLVATCTWTPTFRGAVSLSATVYPTDSNYLAGTTTLPVVIGNRTGLR